MPYRPKLDSVSIYAATMNSATTTNDANDPAFVGTQHASLPTTEEVSKPGPQVSTHPPPPAEPTIQVSLTRASLSLTTAAQFVSSPSAGANVFFTGTTRNTFASRTVTRLEYSAYPALALRTMLTLCRSVQEKYALTRVYLIHRLGVVEVGEESIVIGVSSAHRKAAWDAGEELLESVKDKVEVWKREWFLDGGVVQGKDGSPGTDISDSQAMPAHSVEEKGEWRANADKDGHGKPVTKRG